MNRNCLGVSIPDDVADAAREHGCVGGVQWIYLDGEYGDSPPKASIGCSRATPFRKEWWERFKVPLGPPGWIAFQSPSSLARHPRGERVGGSSRRAAPTEGMMARETHDLLKHIGLQPQFRIDVCSGVAQRFPSGTYTHQLPLYSKRTTTCVTDKARQVARPDLMVVDTTAKTVELIVEFETDTNPKNLLGNYFCVFLAEEYKPKNDPTVYRFDVARTTHFLLACVDSRRRTPNEQAAIEKGHMVAEWLQKAGVPLAGNAQVCSVRTACALAGDDWHEMKRAFEQQVRTACCHLF